MNKKLSLKKIQYAVARNISWVILFILCFVFYCYSHTFMSYQNIINILSQNAYVVIAGLGVSLIMMSGAMDLSVGYMMSCCIIICAKLNLEMGFPEGVSILACILVAILFSMLNTILAIKLKLSLLIASLGTMTIYQGLSFIISDSRSFRGFSDSFKFWGQGYIAGFPFPIILMLVFFLAVNFMLKHTYFGRYIYALGGNEDAAWLAGINVTGCRIMISAIAGFFIGIGSVVLVSRMGTAQSTLGPGTEFTIITGVLLGGVSIQGGAGKLSGILAGILIVSILSNGMQLAGFDTYYQYVIKGVIMLLAIGFDIFLRNRRSVSRKVEE